MSKTITIDLKALQDNCPAQQTVPQAVLDRLQEQLLLSLADASKPPRSKSLICRYLRGLNAKKGIDWRVFARLNRFLFRLVLIAKNDENRLK